MLKRFRIGKRYLHGVVVTAAVLVAAGCTIYMPSPYAPYGSPPQPQPRQQPTAADAQAMAIQTIIEMNQAGKISDEEMLALLRNISSGRTTATAAVATPEPGTSSGTAAVKPEPEPATGPEAEALAGYSPKAQIQGRLRSIGSDTMDNLMAYWGEAFKAYHPGLQVYHEGKGSSTAPPALAENRSDFGPMSRAMKKAEVDEFKAKFGYEPTPFRVAVDAIAVYVHPDNPVAKSGLDFNQLDAIFSADRKRGHSEVKTWGDVGLKGAWARAPIRVYSRNSASGTYGVFQKSVLDKGDYKATNIELEGSSELVQSVAKDKYGIGYSGIGYKTSAVAVVPLSAEPGEEKYPPDAQYAYTGQYPLARFLYLTVNHKPGTAPSDLHREFMTFVYSSGGQFLVTKDGFYPVSSKIAAEDMAQLK